MLNDHYLWRKGYPYHGSISIPLLLKWPQSLDIPESKRAMMSDKVVELRDILPTFLDASGVGMNGIQTDGSSLLNIVRGPTEWRPFVELEHDVVYNDTIHWNALTDGHQKYIFWAYDGSEQFFDLDSDPGEEHDLSQDSRFTAIVSKWRDRLAKVLEPRGPEWVYNGKLMPRPLGQLYSPNYPFPIPLSADTTCFNFTGVD